jgi:hypothetical protein
MSSLWLVKTIFWIKLALRVSALGIEEQRVNVLLANTRARKIPIGARPLPIVFPESTEPSPRHPPMAGTRPVNDSEGVFHFFHPFTRSFAKRASIATDYQLCFRSLFDSGRGFAFPCDAKGQVDLDNMPEKLRNNYFYVRAMVGRETTMPALELH